MNRNYSTEAVVLKTGRFGDYHKNVTILSPEKGIIRAIAHGAYKGKSRLSSITDPYSVSNFDLYHNPVKDVWKINGCESVRLNAAIRENLNAVYNASFWSEIILKSHAAGADYEFVYRLYTDAVRALNRDNKSGLRVTLHFLYRFLISSGFITDFSECGNCGADIDGGMLWFSPAEGCFLCERCASSGLHSIDYSSAVYLLESLSMNLDEAVEKRLELKAEQKIKNMLLTVLKSIIDTPLNTLEYIDYGME